MCQILTNKRTRQMPQYAIKPQNVKIGENLRKEGDTGGHMRFWGISPLFIYLHLSDFPLSMRVSGCLPVSFPSPRFK